MAKPKSALSEDLSLYDIKPRQVLYEEMLFYRDKANQIATQIAQIVKESKKARGDLLVQLYKLLLENKKQLVFIAAQLAPYEHAKLASLEVTTKEEKRMVMRVPSQTANNDDWLKMVGRGNQEAVITDHTPKTIEQVEKEAFNSVRNNIVATSKDFEDAQTQINTLENDPPPQFIEGLDD